MILRDADGDGRAEVLRPFAEGLDLPHALVIRDGWLYVGEVGQVRKLPYRAGELFPLGTPQWVTPPRSLAPNGGGGHPTRSLAFAPDGAEFFVGIGSRGNVADEPIPYASVQRFAADGSGQRTFAAGLRNPIGLAIRPGSNEVWALVNERDGLGDGLVPDYLTRVDDGAFYGWPFAYSGANPDPDFGARRPDLVAQSRLPDLLFQAHSAPIALAFYDGAQFPPDYRGDAIVTLHGSWNSSRPAGYLIARVPFANGKPKGYYEVFATGFWASGSTRAEVWGRPAGIAVAKDGALLVADDLANVIWRISYRP
jgi:glucose/arabinose dehydrogenase